MINDSLLRRNDVRSFLLNLEEKNIDVVGPVFERTSYRYPLAEDFLKNDAEIVLDGLSEMGVFEKEIIDSLTICAECGTTAHIMKLVCPTCSSGRLTKGNVVEHMLCGYVDFEQEFLRQGFKCMKCGKELKTLGVDYRRAGVFYKCVSCGRISAVPVKRYLCTGCGKASLEEELVLKPVYRFVVVKEKFASLKGLVVDLTPLISFIESKGFVCESPAKIAGSSGVRHDFTLYATTPSKSVSSGLVVDIVTETDENKIYEFFTKTFDVKAGESLLIVLGPVNEKARKLAATFGIRMAEFSSLEELYEKARGDIEQSLNRLTQRRLIEESQFLEKLIRDLDKA